MQVARIFNTFGPRMTLGDGRVISNFILQALQGRNITIFGDGTPKRSFQFVDDLVNGLIALMEGGYDRPVNLGSPEAISLEVLCPARLPPAATRIILIHIHALAFLLACFRVSAFVAVSLPCGFVIKLLRNLLFTTTQFPFTILSRPRVKNTAAIIGISTFVFPSPAHQPTSLLLPLSSCSQDSCYLMNDWCDN